MMMKMKIKMNKYREDSSRIKCIGIFLILLFIDLVAIVAVNRISYLIPNVLINFVLIVLGIHIFITLHEFGHGIIYIIYGIAIQYIYIFPLWFICKHDKISVIFELRVDCLGMIIPKIEELQESIYLSMRKKMYNSYLAGPIVNCICFISMVVLYIVNKNLIFLLGAFMNIIMIFMAFGKTDTILGDFYAYKKVKKSEMYFVQLLYNYLMCSVDKVSSSNRGMIIDKLKLCLRLDRYNTINKRGILYLIQEELKSKTSIMEHDEKRFIDSLYKVYISKDYHLNRLDMTLCKRLILYFSKISDYERACFLYSRIKKGASHDLLFMECQWILETGINIFVEFKKIDDKTKGINFLQEETIIIKNLEKYKAEGGSYERNCNK